MMPSPMVCNMQIVFSGNVNCFASSVQRSDEAIFLDPVVANICLC